MPFRPEHISQVYFHQHQFTPILYTVQSQADVSFFCMYSNI